MTDLDQLSAAVGEALRTKGWMLATAESCTGGGVAECITRTSGSSAWFERGFITYTDDSKREMLGVPDEVLDNFGAVSEQTAAAMAEGALRESNADITVSVTGVAGPSGGSVEKPVGMVCFGFSVLGEATETVRCQFEGDRANVRRQTIEFALAHVIALVRRHEQPVTG